MAAQDQQAKDTQDQTHGIARAALGMGMDALSKSHSAMNQTHGNLMQLLSKLPQGGGDPTQDPTQGQGGQGGGSSLDSAIWQAFPSTDPNALQSIAQQAGGDMGQVVQQWAAMSEQDQQDFDHRQLQNLLSLVQAMGSGGPDQEPPAAPAGGPGVGGEGGY